MLNALSLPDYIPLIPLPFKVHVFRLFSSPKEPMSLSGSIICAPDSPRPIFIHDDFARFSRALSIKPGKALVFERRPLGRSSALKQEKKQVRALFSPSLLIGLWGVSIEQTGSLKLFVLFFEAFATKVELWIGDHYMLFIVSNDLKAKPFWG